MSELIKEVLREITEKPLLFAVEVVQFVILVVIIRMILIRVAGTTLRERRERIAADVEKADHADGAYGEAQQRAAAIVSETRRKARRSIEAATTAAQEERRAGLDQAEQEAQKILLQARQTIESEKGRVAGEASEELVTLITQIVLSDEFLKAKVPELKPAPVVQQTAAAK